VKKLTLVVAMALAAVALTGGVTTARAESGQFICGGRLALNYSNVYFDDYYYSYRYSDGGFGFDGGLIGRFAVVEGQMGLNVGANFTYRQPYFGYSYRTSEMAVSVPVLFEINATTFGARSSNVYELVFLQIGLQADYVFDYTEFYRNQKISENSQLWDREKLNFGIVLGAVGYFNSHCSIDFRYYFSFNRFDTELTRWYLYTGSFGLSFYL